MQPEARSNPLFDESMVVLLKVVEARIGSTLAGAINVDDARPTPARSYSITLGEVEIAGRPGGGAVHLIPVHREGCNGWSAALRHRARSGNNAGST
jgi:hypothetical protein